MKNKLARLISFGIVNAQTPAGGVSFAGVPSFSGTSHFESAGGSKGPAKGPMETAVLPGVDPAAPSKMVPGQPSQNRPDPLSPAAQTLKKGPSPLDAYKGLFDNTPKLDADGKEIKPAEPVRTMLDATSKDYTEIAAKLDFTSNISTEQQEAMVAGGEKGFIAMKEVIQNVGEKLVVQMGVSASGIGKTSLELANASHQSAIEKQIFDNTVNTLMITANANFAKPEFNSAAQAIAKQIATKNPSMDSTQVAESTVEYFKLMQPTQEDLDSKTDPDKSDDPNGMKAFFNIK